MYTFDVAVPFCYIWSISFSYLSGLKIMIFDIWTETQDSPGQSKNTFYTARGYSFVWPRAVTRMKGLDFFSRNQSEISCQLVDKSKDGITNPKMDQQNIARTHPRMHSFLTIFSLDVQGLRRQRQASFPEI